MPLVTIGSEAEKIKTRYKAAYQGLFVISIANLVVGIAGFLYTLSLAGERTPFISVPQPIVIAVIINKIIGLDVVSAPLYNIEAIGLFSKRGSLGLPNIIYGGVLLFLAFKAKAYSTLALKIATPIIAIASVVSIALVARDGLVVFVMTLPRAVLLLFVWGGIAATEAWKRLNNKSPPVKEG